MEKYPDTYYTYGHNTKFSTLEIYCFLVESIKSAKESGEDILIIDMLEAAKNKLAETLIKSLK